MKEALPSLNIDYVPANMPGCQMMSNLNYIPASIGIDGPLINKKTTGATYVLASAPETGRWKLNYVPASIDAVSPINKAELNNNNDIKKLSWWEENSFFNYPFMLISAYYGMKWRDDFRQFFNIPDDFCLIGDSGGFQNMTQDSILNPIEVLRWQEKHCQIGLTFDLPIMGNDDYDKKRKKQEQTAVNAKLAYDNRVNKNLKLYAVFQGHTLEEQDYMMECYEKNISLDKFDGIAIGGLVPVAGKTEHLLKVLALFCYKVKDFNLPIHFFGLSGNKIIPYIIYLQRKFDLQITFDSSSYGGGAMRREFWKGNGMEKIFTQKENFDKIPCDCPVCSIVVDWKEYQKDGSLAGGLISLHNLYQTISYIDKLKNEFKDDIINQKYKKFIDVMYEYGPDKAFQILAPLKTNRHTQQSLFSF